MEGHNGRFRNHISIVAERLGSGFWFIGALILGGLVRDVREVVRLAELGQGFGGTVLKGLLATLAFLAVLVVWQLLLWSRTYIFIDGTSLVIERNTLNRKKNTIGIGNISNVNMEQNLFERLIGTCKVKIDTNSLSTADSADVKIVLKKSDAETFCARITGIMEEIAGKRRLDSQEPWAKEREGGRGSRPADALDETPGASLGAMLIHGFYQASFLSLGLVILCLAGAGATAADSLRGGTWRRVLQRSCWARLWQFLSLCRRYGILSKGLSSITILR